MSTNKTIIKIHTNAGMPLDSDLDVVEALASAAGDGAGVPDGGVVEVLTGALALVLVAGDGAGVLEIFTPVTLKEITDKTWDRAKAGLKFSARK